MVFAICSSTLDKFVAGDKYVTHNQFCTRPDSYRDCLDASSSNAYIIITAGPLGLRDWYYPGQELAAKERAYDR